MNYSYDKPKRKFDYFNNRLNSFTKMKSTACQVSFFTCTVLRDSKYVLKGTPVHHIL